MIERFVTLCFNRRGIVWVVFVLTGVYGVYCWTQLPIEAYPDIADATSQVVTQVPGLAAEEVEQQITVPLERALMGTPGMYVMRSKSTFGLSLITVVFNHGVESYWSRQRLQERFSSVSLPYGAQPTLDPLTSPIGEIYRYTLESPTRDLRELSELQFWTVIPRLKQVFGIADVANFGGVTTQFQLVFDPVKLNQYNVSLQQITDAINNNNANAGGSLLNRGEQAFVIRGVGLVRTLEDLGNIVVTQKKGVPVLIRDVGEVTYGNKERRGINGKDDNPDTVGGIVLLLKTEYADRVLPRVYEAVKDLNDNILPKDVKIVPYLDRGDLVSATVHTVGKTVAEGMILVVLVLLLYLGSPRAALIVAVTIPLSLLIAFVFMYFLEIPANLLSLGAIDFGIVVDGAIVVTENILRTREANEGRRLSRGEVLNAALQIIRPMTFGVVVIIVAHFPLFAFQRIEYKLFSPMAFAVGFAVFGALLVSLMLIPGLAYLAYRMPRRTFRNVPLLKLTSGYEAFLKKWIKKERLAVGVFIMTLAGVVGMGAIIGRDFLPYLDEGSIWLQVTLPPGISLDKASQMAGELRKATLEFPEIHHVVTQLGRNDEGTDPWTPSHIEVAVTLHPYNEWKSGLGKQDLIEKLAKRYEQLPWIHVGFTQPMIDGVLDKLSGAHSDLVIKIYGENFDEMRRIGKEIIDVLQTVHGASDVIIDQEPALPQVQIVVDRAAAARQGINVADVTNLIQTTLGGAPIGQVFIAEKSYDISVRVSGAARNDVAAIGNLILTTSSGMRVPLAQVATITLANGESTITREMSKRHLTVRVDLRGRDLASFLDEAQNRIEQDVRYDHGRYKIAWGGQFENQKRAQARLMVVVPAALFLMFVLLYAAFVNVRQPVLILLTVPLATLGGLVALYARDMTLNVSSSVGFIALFGVAVLNGVIMVNNINRWRAELGASLEEAVVNGARERLRPVLMTATVAALGMLPAAMAHGLGSDVQRPIATVVVGGLITATALTLLVLPALYYLIEERAGALAARRKSARDARILAAARTQPQ